MTLTDLLAAILRLFRRASASDQPICADSQIGADHLPGVGNMVTKPENVNTSGAPAQAVNTTWLDHCRPLVQHFEGCRLQAYPDPASGGDPWTVGWGATGPDVKRGTVWSQAQADARLDADLARFAASVDALVRVSITPAQKAALVSFTYNLGVGNLRGSTLLRLINLSDFVNAANEFGKWNHAAGRVLSGLTARRAAERQLFTTGEWK